MKLSLIFNLKVITF